VQPDYQTTGSRTVPVAGRDVQVVVGLDEQTITHVLERHTLAHFTSPSAT